MKLSTFLPAVLAFGASAQTSTVLIDAKTNITFQAVAVAPSYTFGIALDTATNSTDFIGTIIAKGTVGYAGLSLGGGMTKNLLLAAWPSGTSLISSFRQTATLKAPPEVTGAYSMSAISAATYTNATHYVYTFLCSKCILADGTTFKATADSASLGWAFSATASPSKPADHTSSLPRHSSQGQFKVNLKSARSASFSAWAKMAAKPVMKRSFRA